jgi:hypothetical protein
MNARAAGGMGVHHFVFFSHHDECSDTCSRS